MEMTERVAAVEAGREPAVGRCQLRSLGRLGGKDGGDL